MVWKLVTQQENKKSFLILWILFDLSWFFKMLHPELNA